MAGMFQVCQGTCLCAPSPEGYGKGKVLYCYGGVRQCCNDYSYLSATLLPCLFILLKISGRVVKCYWERITFLNINYPTKPGVFFNDIFRHGLGQKILVFGTFNLRKLSPESFRKLKFCEGEKLQVRTDKWHRLLPFGWSFLSFKF